MVDDPSGVLVVIPARNEERRLGACLQALTAAVHRLRAAGESLPVPMVVVLDRCTDTSAAVAARWPATELLATAHGRVGAARAAGVAHGVGAAGIDLDTVWIANTDADSEVPPDWLLTQLQFARSGADLLLGMVHPNPAEIPDPFLPAWYDQHEFVDGHRHVHGANMGVRGSAYAAAGGFENLAVDEDVMLARSIRMLGGRVVSTRASPVLTSARLSGRTPAGMAGYLRDLVGSPGSAT